MAEKVYYPETIDVQPIPEAVETPQEGSANYEGKTNIAPSRNVDVSFPSIPVARETINEVLNTKTKQILGDFTFGEVGALSVGVYENGVTGDIRITPNGITARDINGNTTFSIDGTTGDAVFKGTITAGALVTGSVTVQGQGAFIVNDGTYNVIYMGYLSGGF